MSRFKRSVVHTALILFAVWPAVQIGLVKRYDVNPWKLAGWGMYSAPQIPCDVRVFGLTPDTVGIYELKTIQPELQPALEEFLRWRRGLRNLAEPDDLARAVLDYYSAIDGVSILVVQPVLNRHTGKIEEESTTYDYLR